MLAGGALQAVAAVGFKRRVLYAPLAKRDLRIGNALYLQLTQPLTEGAAVEVQSVSWPETLRFSAAFKAVRWSPAVHVNQVGYVPALPKKAIVGYYLGSLGEMKIPAPQSFRLLDAASGKAVCLTVDPCCGDEATCDVELLGRGGKVLWGGKGFAGGLIHLAAIGVERAGYLIAQVFVRSLRVAQRNRDAAGFAITNPIYLQPRGHTFPAPRQTQLSIHFGPNSRWSGDSFQGESADGEVLVRHRIRQGTLCHELPVGGRFTLRHRDGTLATHSLINVNQRLLEVQRYLYRGRFLRAFCAIQSGDVPPEAWNFPAYIQAMNEVEMEL